jgi:abortive infection bacteriophage resistance protein
MMFKGLKSVTKTKLAAEYGLAEEPFQSWLHVLATLRNFCAHHNRLWNRQLGVKPSIPHGWKYTVPQPDRTYCLAVMLQHLLCIIAPQCKWKERLFALIDSHPNIDLNAMGFPTNWRNSPPWSHC